MNNVIHRQVAAMVFTALFAGVMIAGGRNALADDAKPSRWLIRSVTVHYADLNTSTPEGIRALYERIATAASSVCGPSQSASDANANWDWRSCCRTTMANTVAQIAMPGLTALHQKVTGNPAGQARLATTKPPQG